MKIGDKIYCYRACEVEVNNSKYYYNVTTADKLYTIINIGNNGNFEIINDQDKMHTFSSNFSKNYFFSLREYRKRKLLRIDENR